MTAESQTRPTRATGQSRAWETLNPTLSPWILEAMSCLGFSRMTPVQASTIPLFLGNKDVVVEAVTGSGKTLSFLIPLVERLLRLDEPIKRHHVGAIIISPTRELASQIHSVLLSLLRFHPPSASALDLISDIEKQDDSDLETESTAPSKPAQSTTLKIVPQLLLGGSTPPAQDLAHFLSHSPNLLIATPGRLLELLSSPHVHCPQSSFEALVLDEADRLLDLGFKNDLTKIVSRLPKQRRTGLFSASVSEAVDSLVRLSLRNPVRIAVKVRSRNGEVEGRTPASLRMAFLTTPASCKIPALLRLIRDITPQPQKSIAYVSTCAAVDYFQHILPSLLSLFTTSTSNIRDVAVVPLHGKQSSTVRQKNFSRFLSSTTPTLLLTTDLAARGLDIPTVDMTVQLDPPSDPKAFLHRAGRAGRAGRRGLALVFLTPGRETDEYPSFLSVRHTPVEQFTLPPAPPTSPDIETDAQKVSKRIRAEVLKDRALHEKAQQAFVSWVRAYSKHEAKSIFRVKEIAWSDMAEQWGLLRMPKMPELSLAAAETWNGDRSLGLSIDFDSLAYRDKEREKKRKAEAAELKARIEAGEMQHVPRKRKSESWSDKKGAKDIREERRDKRTKRREKEREGKLDETEKRQAGELKVMLERIREKNAKGESIIEEDGEFQGFGD